MDIDRGVYSDNMKDKRNTIFEKTFNDKNNNLKLVEMPNLPVITWVVATILGKFIESGTFSNVLDVIGFGALFTFAWMEIDTGANYFRKALGLVVMIFTIYNRI